MIRNMEIRGNKTQYGINIGSTLSIDAALAVLKVELEKRQNRDFDIRLLDLTDD